MKYKIILQNIIDTISFIVVIGLIILWLKDEPEHKPVKHKEIYDIESSTILSSEHTKPIDSNWKSSVEAIK